MATTTKAGIALIVSQVLPKDCDSFNLIDGEIGVGMSPGTVGISAGPIGATAAQFQ